ncbi:hypothetical protein GQ600_1766 [Phytophthora cactorum]|nr:hypothetical protein GQ600_1766 [Phytophthora cactorum]
MNECQSACERIHSRLQNLFAELQEMDRKDQPLLATYGINTWIELKRYLCFLQRHHDNKLLFRVFQHRFMVGELEELNKCVTELFVKLLDVDNIYWNIQWEEDCFVQKAVLDASLSDTNRCEYLTPRCPHGLFRKFISKCSPCIPRGDLGLKYYTAEKFVIKRFSVDDSVLNESMWVKIRKEMDVLLLCATQISCACIVLRISAHRRFLFPKTRRMGDLRSFLARCDDNKMEMWQNAV